MLPFVLAVERRAHEGAESNVPAITSLRRAVLAAVMLGALSACSIKNTQQRNEPCLRDYECVQGLVCAPDTSSGDNRLRCTDPVVGTSPIVDGGAQDSGASAQPDAGADE